MKIKKVMILFVFIIFITGNFTNAIIADEENNKDKLYEKISKIEAYKETRIAEPTCDKIRDKIADIPESLLPVISENKTMMDVIIAYDHAPTISDVSTIEKFGGIVYETWDNVVYAAHAEIPVENISKYSLERGVILIEENAEIHTCLDFSVKQIRVRPTVWNTYGYSGNSNHAIAILDTGIDDSHPDLSGKIVKWEDFTYHGYTSPIDKGEHGTHCSGIAVGTGTESGTSTKKYTWSDWFGWENYSLTEYAVATKSGMLSLKLDWDDDFYVGRGNAYIWIDKNQNGNRDPGEYIYGGSSPLMYSASVSSGRYMVGVGAYDYPAALEDFYCQINAPSQSLGDGHNLLKGVAPSCKLAGLKILDDYGTGSYADLISALNWLYQNAETYGIIMASMSIGGPSSTTVDTAVNNLVSSGVVCVAAAGNSQGLDYIGSPGTAAKALTVGAVNDEDYLTSYSSIGDPNNTPLKPDVLAPGGSYYTGDKIISVDSNDADNTFEIDLDRYSDDYRAGSGTSMACPHISGLAALVADAMGTWQYNEGQALKVKQIILMTAYEVGSAENPSYTPPFNFGGKDNKEGYGRVCADAAIEAATMEMNLGVSYIFSFGNNVWNKKVWARQISLEEGTMYNFTMDVPATSIYDLYLYDKEPDGNGEPILLNYSCDGVGSDEFIQYSCGENGTYYIVAKWYSGSGQAEIICQELNDPPMANFTYSPSDPSTQDEIQFTDNSIDSDGYIISWSWDFGDGNTSTIQHPTHQYADNGTYIVTLNVTDDDGATNETYLGITVANVPPVVNFIYAPENPTTNDTIIFTDTSTDADGTIISWLWGFGDNTTSLEQNPIHQYADNGTYAVTLNVTDDDGGTNETSKQIIVSNVGPAADFTWSPTNPTIDDVIQFNDTSTDPDGNISNWTWNFGDGNTSNEQNPTHQYAEGNTYNVTLNVTDNDGITDEISQQIIVNVIPIASFSYTPPNPYTSDIISFTDQSIDPYGPIIAWLWDFGDGVNSMEQNPTHQYSDNGTYMVTLNVTDQYGATNETAQQIVVSNVGPIANFTYYPLFPTDLQNVTFTDNSTDSDGYIVSWLWDFGDGNFSAEQNIIYQYADNGTYIVTLNITDDDGATNETYVELMVANVPPVVNFTYTPSIPTINDVVQFNDTSIDLDGIIVNWTWDFGNGISYEQNTTHIYTIFGSYNVKLTVKDNDENTSNMTKQIITKIIYTNMTQDDNETTIDLQNETDMIIVINTTNSTTVNVSKYSGNPTGEDISGNITAIGKYIGIEVENESIIVWPINITIYYTQEDLNNSNLNENQLLGIYFWNNTVSEWQLYNNTGVNTTNQSGYEGYCWANAWHLTPLVLGGDNEPPSKVTLTVTDAKDGKLDLSWTSAIDNVGVDYYNIYHNAPSPIVVYYPTTTYTHTGLTNGQKYTYNVSAVDTSGNEGEKSDSKSDTPTSSGGGGNGGNGGGTPPLPPSNNPPIANASAGEPYTGYVDEEITFDGSLSYDPDGEIVSWYWDFGDGTNGTGEIVEHSYSHPDTYTVTLTVTDNEDAEDTDETTAFITQANRDPSTPEITGPTKGSKNIVYDFSATSVDLDNNSIEYTFDWDDGNTSISDFLPNGTMYTATHSWTLAGKYVVTVIAYDNKTYSGTAQLTVLIDACYVNEIGYLIDEDTDGIYDSFYSNATGEKTSVELDNGIYLIDIDNDGMWNYEYNPETNALTIPTEEGVDRAVLVLVLAVVLVVAVIVIAFICFRCYVRKQGKK